MKKMLIIHFLSLFLFAQEPFINIALLDKVSAKYGKFAKHRFLILKRLIYDLKDKNELVKLNVINRFFNKIDYKSDLENYNQEDYWATPFEFLAKDSGDCEDFVIGKYFTLTYLGVESKKLFFIYVKSKKFSEPHMVLAYFKTPNSTPLILDNYNKKVLPASKRKDLIPIYSFNLSTLNNNSKVHKKLDELLDSIKRKKI